MCREGTALSRGTMRAKERWWAPGVTARMEPLVRVGDNGAGAPAVRDCYRWAFCGPGWGSPET